MAVVACLCIIGIQHTALGNNKQYMLGTNVNPHDVCPGGKFRFHSYKKEAFCGDTGAGGIVCGPVEAGAMETFEVDDTLKGEFLKGPHDNKYCSQNPGHFVACTHGYSDSELTADYAPFALIQSSEDPDRYAMRFGSSGYCSSVDKDVLKCESSWFDLWESFRVDCA